MKPINELNPDGVKVLLMRRTSSGTVRTSVGSMWPGGQIRGWDGFRPPTHFCPLPPFTKRGTKAGTR